MYLWTAVLALVGLTIADYRREDHIETTERAGGPHGDAWDDFGFVNAASGHRRLVKITLGPCYEYTAVSYVKFEFINWQNKDAGRTFSEHGKMKAGSATKSLELTEGKTINYVNVRTAKVGAGWTYKTRIVGLSFSNGIDPALTCGVKDDGKAPYDWQTDGRRAFLYFSGGQGDALDNIVGHTIPLEDYF